MVGAILCAHGRDPVALLREASARVGTPVPLVHYWSSSERKQDIPLFVEFIHTQPFRVQQEVVAYLVQAGPKLPPAEADDFFAAYARFLEQFVKPTLVGTPSEELCTWLEVTAKRWNGGGRGGKQLLSHLVNEGIEIQQDATHMSSFFIGMSWVNRLSDKPPREARVGEKRTRLQDVEAGPSVRTNTKQQRVGEECEGVEISSDEDMAEAGVREAGNMQEDIYFEDNAQDWRNDDILANSSDEEDTGLATLSARATPVSQPTSVSADLLELAEELKEGLQEVVFSQDSQEVFGTQGRSDDPIKEMTTFLQSNLTKAKPIIEHLRLASVDESVFIALAEELFGAGKEDTALMGALECQTFVSCLVLPRALQLKVLRGLLIPLLQAQNELLPPQAEVVGRLVKDGLHGRSGDLVMELLREALSEQSRVKWSAALLKLLTDIVNLKVPMPDDIVQLFVNALQAHVKGFSDSLKFAHLISSFVRKHPTSVHPYAAVLRDIVKQTSCSMTKGILGALDRMLQ